MSDAKVCDGCGRIIDGVKVRTSRREREPARGMVAVANHDGVFCSDNDRVPGFERGFPTAVCPRKDPPRVWVGWPERVDFCDDCVWLTLKAAGYRFRDFVHPAAEDKTFVEPGGPIVPGRH